MHGLILYSAIVTPQSKPMRVLVIDDDPMSRDLLSVLLQAEGYEVECADSGETALVHLRGSANAPGLVLADAQMPGLAGSRLAGELRHACSPATLLLAMSGSQPPQEAIARFDGFLLKPFSMEQIASALAARNPPSGERTSRSRRAQWTVVRGPAGRSPSNSKLISIQASAPEPASRRRARSQPQEARSAEALPSDIPVLDETIYQRLAASMSTPQLQQMYAMCIADARARIASMRQLVAASDAAAFIRQAHAIKGGCGMLGATELRQMAAELEANGLQADATEGRQAVNSLDELTAACDRLERILGSRL
jgi:CheY-like chemotaxis protein